jgi:hypothetical protein
MSLALIRDNIPSTRRHVDVCEVVEELRRQSPRAGADRIAALLAERIEEDHHLLISASRFIAEKVLAAAVTARQRRQQAIPTPRQRAERRVAEKAEVAKLAAKVREIAVLDMVINGTQLRFMTGTEVARLGAGFTKLAERVPADAYVGECVTEAEAMELLRA